jgi:hypothetical protein
LRPPAAGSVTASRDWILIMPPTTGSEDNICGWQHYLTPVSSEEGCIRWKPMPNFDSGGHLTAGAVPADAISSALIILLGLGRYQAPKYAGRYHSSSSATLHHFDCCCQLITTLLNSKCSAHCRPLRTFVTQTTAALACALTVHSAGAVKATGPDAIRHTLQTPVLESLGICTACQANTGGSAGLRPTALIFQRNARRGSHHFCARLLLHRHWPVARCPSPGGHDEYARYPSPGVGILPVAPWQNERKPRSGPCSTDRWGHGAGVVPHETLIRLSGQVLRTAHLLSTVPHASRTGTAANAGFPAVW